MDELWFVVNELWFIVDKLWSDVVGVWFTMDEKRKMRFRRVRNTLR